MVNVAVLGYGTVGGGVVEVLQKNASVISRKAGEEINVKYVLDLREFPGDPVEKILVHDYDTIVNDPEIRVIAEAMGRLTIWAELTSDPRPSVSTAHRIVQSPTVTIPTQRASRRRL